MLLDRKRSKLWTFFTKDSDGKAKCDLCHSSYSVRGGLTTNLKKHLSTKHRSSYDTLLQIHKALPSSIPDDSNGSPDLHIPSTSQQSNTDQQNAAVRNQIPRETSKNPLQTKHRQTHLTTFTRKPMNIAREKKINDLVSKLIIKDLQPFSVVEDTGFIELINYLGPNYQIPSRYIHSNS